MSERSLESVGPARTRSRFGSSGPSLGPTHGVPVDRRLNTCQPGPSPTRGENSAAVGVNEPRRLSVQHLSLQRATPRQLLTKGCLFSDDNTASDSVAVVLERAAEGEETTSDVALRSVYRTALIPQQEERRKEHSVTRANRQRRHRQRQQTTPSRR